MESEIDLYLTGTEKKKFNNELDYFFQILYNCSPPPPPPPASELILPIPNNLTKKVVKVVTVADLHRWLNKTYFQLTGHIME